MTSHHTTSLNTILYHITLYLRYGKHLEDTGFITLLLKSGVPLNNVGVGADCVLDPSLKYNTYGNPAKYILMIVTHAVLHRIVQQVGDVHRSSL